MIAILNRFAFAVALLPLTVHASNLPDYPFIHAGGEGFAMVVPDIGEIDFDVSANAADPAAATDTVAARVAEVRAMLAAQAGDGDEAASSDVHDMRKEMVKGANPGSTVESD